MLTVVLREIVLLLPSVPTKPIVYVPGGVPVGFAGEMGL